MLILLAGPQPQALYAPVLATGHRVLGLAQNVRTLEAQLAREHPEGLLIEGLLDDAPALLALLQAAALPAVLLTEAPAAEFRALATVLPRQTPLAEALAALVAAAAPTATPAGPEREPAAGTTEIEPAGREAGKQQQREALSPGLLLYPVVGGAGATTLALTLAAATAQAGLHTLVASSDHLALLARLGISGPQPQPLADRLYAMAFTPGGALPDGFDVVIGEGRPQDFPAAARSQLPVVLLTRPTGAGRLNAVRAVTTLRRQGLRVLRVVARPGLLSGPEFAQVCQGDDAHFPPVETLPDDLEVPALEDVAAHALATRTYGPAVQRLARRLLLGLPWPVATAAAEATPDPPRRWGLPALQIELTD